MTSPVAVLKATDYASTTFPTWCPGCGDFGVMRGVQQAMADLGLKPENVAIISGIGCSSNLPHFLRCYGMHTLHGRLLPVAMGVKLANPELTVIGTGGDGDGYAIGAGHFTHAARRNLDMTYIVMNNQIYGLTTGQTSPTTSVGHKTKSTPEGNIEPPFNPLGIALAEGATYVARGFSGDQKGLAKLIEGGIKHKGFALIDVFSPCITFNKENTYQWFRQNLVNINEPKEGTPHDVTDRVEAFRLALPATNPIPYGLFYKEEGKPTYDGQDPTLSRGINPSKNVKPRDVTALIDAMK